MEEHIHQILDRGGAVMTLSGVLGREDVEKAILSGMSREEAILSLYKEEEC